MAKQTYRIEGMDCADCARTVQKGVTNLKGARDVEVDFVSGMLKFEGDIPREALQKRVEALGYRLGETVTPHPPTPSPCEQVRQQAGRGGETSYNNLSPSKREANTIPLSSIPIAQPEQDRPFPISSPLPEGEGAGVRAFFRYLLRERNTQFALAGGALLLVGVVAALLGAGEALVTALYTLATAVALYPVARSGINNLIINRDFNINLLMTIAAVGALLINEALEAATVVFLFAVGEALEGYTADRARQSIKSLMTLAPALAVRLRDGREETIPVEALRVDDLIRVKSGERIPMDGVVTAGESGVDQAPLTGESVPVHKAAGDEVYAGTIAGDGALTIRVTHRAEDNTINRIIRMVEEAQSVRAPSQRLIDQFARVYTPAVVVIAALVAVVPPLLFSAPFYDTPDGHGWLYRALSLLVIACPCALVISTPVTVISAITNAARRGVLIKGGAHLEALGKVSAVAFDKTGTLTRGRPIVTAVRAADCATSEVCPNVDACQHCDDVLALASAVERGSAHPLARAVVDAAQARGVSETYAPPLAVESLAGRGVRGKMHLNGGERLVTVGSHRLFDDEYPHAAALCGLAHDAEADGQTTMLLSDGERVRGFIAAEDALRPESAGVIRDLNALGLHTVMLTGDHAAVAESVGRRVGVGDVRAGLLPADKVAAVRGLQAGGVVMVGDGINDTPALAAATVGVAMGGAGSAQALETADVALMADDLTQLPFAVRLSRFARRLIVRNVAISFGIKALFIALALFGVTSLWAAVLADVGTSLLVTLNGTRAGRYS